MIQVVRCASLGRPVLHEAVIHRNRPLRPHLWLGAVPGFVPGTLKPSAYEMFSVSSLGQPTGLAEVKNRK